MDNPILTAMSEAIQPKETEEQVEEQVVENVEEEPEAEEESFEEEESTEEEVTKEETEDVSTDDNAEDAEDEDWGDNDWLSEDEPEAVAKENDASFDEIADVLGMGGFSDKQSVLDEIKTINKEREELRVQVEKAKSETPFANDDIKRANELAKSGGDFNSYLQLSQVDYNQVDDDTLLMEGLIKPSFGTEDEALEYFNGMTEPQKKMEAQRFRAGLIQEQDQKKQELFKAANDRRKTVNEGITKSLKGVDELFGMKLSNADKKKMFGKLTSDKGLVNDIFYDKKGNLDYNKMVKTAYILENFEAIVKNAITKSRNKANKEILDEVTQPNLGKKSSKVSKKATVVQTPLEKYMSGLQNRER